MLGMSSIHEITERSLAAEANPEDPSIQIWRYKVPNTIPIMIFGTLYHDMRVLGPFG